MLLMRNNLWNCIKHTDHMLRNFNGFRNKFLGINLFLSERFKLENLLLNFLSVLNLPLVGILLFIPLSLCLELPCLMFQNLRLNYQDFIRKISICFNLLMKLDNSTGNRFSRKYTKYLLLSIYWAILMYL